MFDVPGRPKRVALVDCAHCRQRHKVRVDEWHARADCGALVEAFTTGAGATIRARVWPPGEEHLVGRLVTVLDVLTA